MFEVAALFADAITAGAESPLWPGVAAALDASSAFITQLCADIASEAQLVPSSTGDGRRGGKGKDTLLNLHLHVLPESLLVASELLSVAVPFTVVASKHAPKPKKVAATKGKGAKAAPKDAGSSAEEGLVSALTAFTNFVTVLNKGTAPLQNLLSQLKDKSNVTGVTAAALLADTPVFSVDKCITDFAKTEACLTALGGVVIRHRASLCDSFGVAYTLLQERVNMAKAVRL